MHSALLLAFSVLVHASSWHPPASTISLYDKADPAGWMPAHTAAPEAFELVKRQSTNFGPVCGYLEGSKSKEIYCTNAYCAINSNLGALGCCESLVTVGGTLSLADCFYQTACYDLTDSCDTSCQQNTLNGFCSSSAYPYCFQYQRPGGSYSAFRCTSTPTFPMLTVDLLITYDNEGPVETSATSSFGGITDSFTQSPTTSSFTPISSSSLTETFSPAPVPFTQSQQSGGSPTTTQVAPASTTNSAAMALRVSFGDLSHGYLVLGLVAVVFAL